MKRNSAFLCFAILCSISIAMPARAATSNVDQRAVKFGTTLPATCWTGDIFFNTTAPAGSNLYACVAPNTRGVQGGGSGGSGGGASNTGQLADFTDTRVSALEIDTTLPAGGTRVRAGTAIRSITASPEKMIGSGSWCAAGGQLWKYVDAGTGAVKVDANANVTLANIAFTAITPGSNSAAGFPQDGSFAIASYTCGNNAANQWDTSPFNDWRAFMSNIGLLNGPFMVVTPGARWTVGVDTTKVGNGANATLLVGAVSPLSQAAGTVVCDDGAGGVKDTNCSGTSAGHEYPIFIPFQYYVPGIGGNCSNATISNGGSGCGVNNGGSAAGSIGFTRSSSLSDFFEYSFIFPGATSIRGVISGWVESSTSNSLSFDFAIGCDRIGNAINSGSLNAASHSNPASSTVTNQVYAFAATAIATTNCGANDLAYLKVSRQGTYTGNFDTYGIILWVTP